jgi:hypothetical protein
MTRIIAIILKTTACGLIFFMGTILGGMIASAVGLPDPAMPEGTDAGTLVGYLLLASLGIGALLAYLASRLDGSVLLRWLTLATFGWVVYSLSTNIEATIYTTFSSASLYKVVMDLVAFLVCSLAAVLFFRTDYFEPKNYDRISPMSFSFSGWIGRIAIAWAAFTVVYIGMGKIVEPFVIDYYQQGLFELTAPGWGQILTAQMVRSLLFLGVCLALMARWNRTRTGLWISLTAALYLLVGGFYMLQAYWFPLAFRMVHSLEIFADSILYAGCLIACFVPKARGVSQVVSLATAEQN